jgi:hypothetical protein
MGVLSDGIEKLSDCFGKPLRMKLCSSKRFFPGVDVFPAYLGMKTNRTGAPLCLNKLSGGVITISEAAQVSSQSTVVTDGRTDGRTDRQTTDGLRRNISYELKVRIKCGICKCHMNMQQAAGYIDD